MASKKKLQEASAKAAGESPNEELSPVQTCPAHVGGPAGGKSPCAGFGLSSQANTDEFVSDFKGLQKSWPTLKPDEREAKLKEIFNKQLAKSGVPSVGVVRKNLPAGNPGHFDFPTWRMALNDGLLKQKTLPDAEAKSLANTVYHESRHAEQWYLIAQKQAADGKDAATISKDTSMPLSVAKEAAKHPLTKGSEKEKCAQALHDSVYGKDADARNKKLTGVMSALGAYNKASDNYKKISGDPKATYDQKKKAYDNLVKTKTAFEKAHKEYRELPEEADAFETGDKVNW